MAYRFFSFILLLFLALPLRASSPLEETITALVDERSQVTHKKLLTILFQYEEDYLTPAGEVQIVKVVKTLKENGLLQIFYREPVKLYATFESRMEPLFMMKAISDTLNKMGYHYILTHELKRDGDTTEWTIGYTSQHVIDPLTLFDEMGKYNIAIDSIVAKQNRWRYRLSSQEAILEDALQLATDTDEQTFNDPRGEYWFHVDDNASIARIKSRYPDLWHPYIICYNANLNILKIYKRDRSTRRLKLILPADTKYIKLTDMFTPENLKHGINIQIEGAE